MISVVENKELIYDVNNYDVILIGTSINNALGNGFQRQVKKAFPEVDEANKRTPYGDRRKLGVVQVINTCPIFCLLYINVGRYRPDLNPEFVDYNALESCMKLINTNFKGKNIASTVLGESVFEGDGDKERIMNILKNNSDNINLTVYDYEQQDYKADRVRRWSKIVDAAEADDKELYRKLKIQYFWENEFGVLKPVPENLTEHEIKKLIKENKNKGF